jgi:hypothetical protein
MDRRRVEIALRIAVLEKIDERWSGSSKRRACNPIRQPLCPLLPITFGGPISATFIKKFL